MFSVNIQIPLILNMSNYFNVPHEIFCYDRNAWNGSQNLNDLL